MPAVPHATPLRLASAYLATCLIWGSTYFAIKVGLASFDPLFYAGLRYALAALLTWVVARVQGVSFKRPLAEWLPACGVGVLFITVSNGLVFWAETRLDSGFTALLITTSPLWTAALAPLIAGDRAPRLLGWLGIAAGFVGTAVLLQPWRSSAVDPLAALAVEGSVVVWVIGALSVRRFGRRFHPMALAVAQMGTGSAVLLLLCAARGKATVGPLTPHALAALGYLVVFGSVVAFTAYFYLLRHWEAARVSTSTYVNPVIAVALGALVLGEPVTLSMGVGACVVLGGVALVLQDGRRGGARES
jgi:drug/metabolite transporter (DMT)-like permease